MPEHAATGSNLDHPWLQARVLQLPGLAHVFTTREGGVSEGAFASLNFKYPLDAGDEAGGDLRVRQNRQRICAWLGLPAEHMVACQQTHGDRVQIVTAADRGRGALRHQDGFADTDGLLTDQAGIALMLMVADCYPVPMADPVRRVAGGVHSGWRGTQQQIAHKAIERMVSDFGSDPADIRLAIGPGIGFGAFEVGAEVIEAFADQIDLEDPELVCPTGEKYRLNLPEILRRQALAAGLNSQHVEIVPGCTLSESRYYSYRREGGVTGRQAGLIGWLSGPAER
ncbi:MAG: peptidoglycan editing factor PgeF [Candidatus Melainabacteria bacterium HGW-Melainabacteria-1]|nr:MAG: peptidoglycan editing factor PgeF [Candidatus Melainabacteria bacterium HGW-Melainabacteria-1]